MAKGNSIIVTCDPNGRPMEGYVTTAEKPGTVLQINAAVALKGGRHTYVVYNRDADADRPVGALWILLEDRLQGRLATTAYVAGERCFLWSPAAGEEFNMLVANLAGTADDHALGEILMIDDGTGLLIATTGSPETESFVLLEAITDPTADTLAWVQYTGY